MLPDGNLIWSLVGVSKVENIGLVVFYLPLSSNLSHLLSVEYSKMEMCINKCFLLHLIKLKLFDHLVKTICRIASMVRSDRRCNIGDIVHLKPMVETFQAIFMCNTLFFSEKKSWNSSV